MFASVCRFFVHFRSAIFAAVLALAASRANASTIDISAFTLTQSTFANGSIATLEGGLTLIFTGPNDGSDEPGHTTLTGTVFSSGLFQFDWAFTTLDDAGFESAGYLIDGSYTFLADTTGESGSVSVPITAGSLIGFQMNTVDNTGRAGVLTVSDFSAPVPLASPESGSFGLMASGIALGIAAQVFRRLSFRRLPRNGVFLLFVIAGAMTCPLGAQQSFYTGTNVTGGLGLIGTVNLTTQGQAVQTLGVERNSSEVALRIPAGRLRAPSLHPHPSLMERSSIQVNADLGLRSLLSVGPPIAPGLTINQASGLSGFNALSHFDQRMANGGNQFSIEPPSQSIAATTNYILEGVNDAVQVFYPNGQPALPAVLSSNQVFGLAPAINRSNGINGVYLTDMRVYYDLNFDRWMIIQRDLDNDSAGNPLSTSHLYVAVSQTGDPTQTYNIYLMETTNGNHRGCPCLADYPQVGADQFGFYISWDEYNSFASSYVDASILCLSKADLMGGKLQPTAFQFFIPFVNGYEFAITPSTTPPGAVNFLGSGGLEYFASTLSESSYNGGVALWALTNTSSLGLAPNPILTMVVIPTISYLFPDVAQQPAGPIPYGLSLSPADQVAFIDGGDNRVQSLSYASASLYLTFQAGVYDQNTHYQDGGVFVVLSPTYRDGVLAAKVVNQGYLGVTNNHLLRPAIAVNALGVGSITATLVGPDWYPSAVVIPFNSSSTPSTLEISGQGTLPEDGFTGYPGGGVVGVARWGDYNAAVVSNDGAIWSVAQYIGSYPRTALANWNTYITRIQP